MKNIISLLELTSKIKLKSSDFIFSDFEKKSKEYVFLQKITEGKFKTDDDAAHFFYNDNATNSNYKNLKRKFKHKLYSSLPFINPAKMGSEFGQGKLYCIKYSLISKILWHFGISALAVEITKNVLKKATAYELNEFSIDACRQLRNYYGQKERSEEEFFHYHEKFQYHQKLWIAESLAEELFSRLCLPYKNKNSYESETLTSAISFDNQLQPYLDEYDSPKLHLLGYIIKDSIFHMKNDYPKIIENLKAGIAFFEAKPYEYKTPFQVFSNRLMQTYLQLKLFKEGKELAKLSDRYYQVGSHNWYGYMESLFLLALHAKEYDEAWEVYYNAITHKKFKHRTEYRKETWLIYEGYANFLIETNHISIDVSKPDIEGKKFRLNKLLNSVPNFAKDKRGHNIPVLILQILFTIIRKEYDKAIDRVEAIEKYATRYIKKDENFRSNCIIKMLVQVPLASFHKVAVERKAEKYYKMLKSQPLKVSNQIYEIEIIPYEEIWEIIINSLETKRFNTNKRKRNSSK